MIYLSTFKLNDKMAKNKNIYPFNILKNKGDNIFVFDNITVLYGNNGSGKSTLLNIIAHKFNLKGKERNNPEIEGMVDYFSQFVEGCEYGFGENEFGKKLNRLPNKSRYIKSEEILYEIRKFEQKVVLQEGIKSDYAREFGLEKANEFFDEANLKIQTARFEFAQEKYSNGETTLQFLEDTIEPDNLYLLDEPEVSLSPQNQVKLAEEINRMARYLGDQFIIATHSPFMLGILDAKIYNIDNDEYKVQKWNELENVKYFYDFFKNRENEFEND